MSQDRLYYFALLKKVGLFCAFLSLLLTTTASAQTCPSGLSSVTVDIIRNSDGTPATPSSKTRTEHVHVSSRLAEDLGITSLVDSNPDGNPTIRVIVDSPAAVGGDLVNTGNFTVAEIFTDNVNQEIRIYKNKDADDDSSGFFKLFENDPNLDITTALVTVHNFAPSVTTIVENQVTTVQTNFCEPSANGSNGFFDRVELEADKRFVLLVPHAGDIEEGTGEQIGAITQALGSEYSIDANVWEASATWIDDTGSERFHITSDAHNGPSFPGYGRLLAAPKFDNDRHFQYAASLHGFGKFQGHGLVLGGRMAREAKCYLANRIQQRLTDLGHDTMAFYVWDHDGEENQAVEVADGNGDLISTARDGDVGLKGTDRDNLVNVVSPNEDGDAGFGGMQIEESPSLRGDAVYEPIVLQEIARAFGEMILDSTLIDTTSTAQCDALVAGPTAPTGRVIGRVWEDVGGNGIQDLGEADLDGITVELLRDALVVATTSTDNAGTYAFDNLFEADYSVRVVIPGGFQASPRGAGSDSTQDSDIDSAGSSLEFLLAADGEVLVDAGLEPILTAEVGDQVWIDSLRNGLQDVEEAPLAGVTVELRTSTGTVVATTVTDSLGQYRFQQVNPGDYRLRFVPPNGFGATDQVVGFPDLDSDVNPQTGETANFSLVAGQVDLSRDAGFVADCETVALVSFGSEWRAFESGDNFATNWFERVFDDATWGEKQGRLGFPQANVNATISDTNSVTYYVRHSFEVSDPTLFQDMSLTLFRDDAAIVYLNDVEVLRSNLPAGTITSTTPALSSSRTTATITVPSSALRIGTNTLAVEIHGTSAFDSDIAFDLELVTTVCDPCRVKEATYNLVDGTYMEENDPFDTHGSSSKLKLDSEADEENNFLMRWNLSGGNIPAGAEILHAEIKVTVSDVEGSDPQLPIYPLSVDWDERDTQWNHADSGVAWQTPGAKGSLDRDESRPFGVITLSTLGEAVVTLNQNARAAILDWQNDPANNHGVIVTTRGEPERELTLRSDNTSDRPVLRVLYLTANTCGN